MYQISLDLESIELHMCIARAWTICLLVPWSNELILILETYVKIKYLIHKFAQLPSMVM